MPSVGRTLAKLRVAAVARRAGVPSRWPLRGAAAIALGGPLARTLAKPATGTHY